MIGSEQLRTDLRNFLQFTCEKKSVDGEAVIKSTINLFRKIPSTRPAVLKFFEQLFDDLVDKYLEEKNRIKSAKNESDRWWWLLLHHSEAKPIVKERKSNDSFGAVEGDTPMSPPVMETGSSSMVSLLDSQEPTDINLSINRYVDLIGDTLMHFVVSDESNCRQMVIEMCLNFLSGLSRKYSFKTFTPSIAQDRVKVFSEYIKFWVSCPIVDLFLKIIMIYSSSLPSPQSNQSSAISSQSSSSNCQTLIQRLIESSSYSDWIIAYFIASIPSHSNSQLFSTCIQCLLQSEIQSEAFTESSTNILSYISEHNPQAIINASRSNIPFLLKLASNSKPLLNLLALEAVKQVDVQTLNDLSQTMTANIETSIMFCILNANNSYQLLQLVFDACSHKDANEIVREKSFSLLSAIVIRLHELVYTKPINSQIPILETLKANKDQLVMNTINRPSGNLKRLQTRIIELLCLNFGLDFTGKVFHQILNFLNTDGSCPSLLSSPSPILVNLIKYLKLSFGVKVYECFRRAVQEPIPKEAKFWANLLDLYEGDESLELDIDELTSKFTQYVQSDIIDQRIFYTLKLIFSCIERDPRLVKRPKHHLCISLMSTYMKLVESICTDEDNLGLKMEMITVCQKLMSHLSKNLEANQHILTRTLIEAELQRGDRSMQYSSCERLPIHVNLFKENLEFGNISKFRKISLNPRKRVIHSENNNCESSLRRQLLLDAVKCCVTESQAFATLLIECVTPDVMFNDKPWPDEDFLKVTIERDLYIARKFDSNPVLWDFCELIAKTGNLYSCSVLIRALMAVQLCCWASATASKEKLGSTKKLVSLIASSELVPTVPFKYLPQIMESLTPWEIFCVLNDLWRYMRDNSPPAVRPSQGSLKTYLERLRIITSQKLPGPVFVKIFKGLHIANDDEKSGTQSPWH